MVSKQLKLEILKVEMDKWIKQLHRRVTRLSNASDEFETSTSNINHNYQRIKELSEQVEHIKNTQHLLIISMEQLQKIIIKNNKLNIENSKNSTTTPYHDQHKTNRQQS